MRILYLAYVPQDSFETFSRIGKTRCPWVDELLYELSKRQNISVGLAVPVKGNQFEKGQADGISLFGLPAPERLRFFRKTYQRFRYLLENEEICDYASKAIAEFKPDIVQIFGSENPFGLIIRKQNIPVIIHIQGYLQVWQRKWYAGISKHEQYKFSDFKDLLLRSGNYHEFFIFRKRADREARILQSCKYFMGRTNFDKRLAALFSPDSKYFHCEEFIRPIFFERHWNLPLSSELTCFSILKGTTYKGIDLLVEVLLILKKHWTLPLKFRICGVSADEEVIRVIKKKYKNEIAGLNIEFIGRLAANEIVEQLCNSNFYLHPSYIENSPNSVCEAMALGMPVISTNVGGTSSLINDNQDGILVQEGDPYSMAAAIIYLTNNYEYAKLLGENARKRALTRHNPDKLVTTMIDIYKTILLGNDRE